MQHPGAGSTGTGTGTGRPRRRTSFSEIMPSTGRVIRTGTHDHTASIRGHDDQASAADSSIVSSCSAGTSNPDSGGADGPHGNNNGNGNGGNRSRGNGHGNGNKGTKDGGSGRGRGVQRRHSINRHHMYSNIAGTQSETSSNQEDSTTRWYSGWFFEPNQSALERMKRLLKSRFWKVTIMLFTMVLLFGAPIQHFFPEDTRSIFNAIYLTTIVILLVDIFLMVFVQKKYFNLSFNLSFKNWRKGWNEIECGSFMFWFDLISVLSMLFNVSFILKLNAAVIDINIYPDEAAEFSYKDTYGVSLSIILNVLFRIARVARFLRIQSVLDFTATARSFYINMSRGIQRCIPNIYTSNVDKGLTSSLTSVRNVFSRGRSSRRDPSGQVWDTDMSNRHLNAFTEAEERIAVRKIETAWMKYKNKDKDKDAAIVSDNNTINKNLRTSKNSGNSRLRRFGTMSVTRVKGVRGCGLGRQRKFSNTSMHTEVSRRRKRARRNRSQIGLEMNDNTTKLVAIGIILAVVLSVTFAFHKDDKFDQSVQILSLHNTIHSMDINSGNGNGDGSGSGTSSLGEYDIYLDNLMETYDSWIPNLIFFEYKSDSFTYSPKNQTYSPPSHLLINITDYLYETITVTTPYGDGLWANTTAHIDTMSNYYRQGYVSLIFLIFIVIIWFIGLVLFAGPVTTLVVIPIERMIRLLDMLVKDPLGYDTTKKFKRFAAEEDELASFTHWTSDNLKGMETSFLMDTILRTGSLMKVGFGAAGAKIIRENLMRNTGVFQLQNRGAASTVSCVFMFCDIRQFTDATECLQEEVFLFTNKIAAVVHSICHSFGGSANKNIGDAFLLSWKLDEPVGSMTFGSDEICASEKQADKALLSVVNICTALCYEEYYVKDVSETARTRLNKKFGTREEREGNLVKIGFGLHAGLAVEGAIGSDKKLDATYLGNEVELAETLESTTKKYGVSLLMSGKFYKLLHVTNQRRCRQIDELFFILDYEADDPSDVDIKEDSDMHMRLFTYDIDLEALRNQAHEDEFLNNNEDGERSTDFNLSRDNTYESGSNMSLQSSVDTPINRTSARRLSSNRPPQRGLPSRSSFSSMRPSQRGLPSRTTSRTRFSSMRGLSLAMLRQSLEHRPGAMIPFPNGDFSQKRKFDNLVLPTGPVKYHSTLWATDDIRIIRARFTSVFFQKFNVGFRAYLNGEWQVAKSELEFVKNRFKDKPSEVLLEKMARSNYIPPNFFRQQLGKE